MRAKDFDEDFCATMGRMVTPAGIQALLLTADASLINRFSDLSQEFGIEAYSSADCKNITYELNWKRYEALVLDFDTVPGANAVLGSLQTLSLNKNTVIFAVASKLEHRELALNQGAHFLLQRPIETSSIKETLSAAYDLMWHERRRYFRCAAELPVLLTLHRSNRREHCTSINVSSDGLAVKTADLLIPAETVDVALSLPNGFTVEATGIVIWDDKHGKSGLKIRCKSPQMRDRLDTWLDSQLETRAGKALGDKTKVHKEVH